MVAAVIGWLALGPEPRHDGLTRARAERIAALGIDTGCVKRSHCRAVAGHWRCATTLPDGHTVESTSAPHDQGAPAAIAVFAC